MLPCSLFLLRSVIYFWISITALCIAPFVFNPHQFSLGDFIIDYREYLRWMSRGNSRSHANSWIGYCRLSRTKITGFKKKRLGHPSEKLSTDVPRVTWRVIVFSEVLAPIALAIIFTVAYLFVKSVQSPAINGLLRLTIVAFGPIVLNAVLLIALFIISIFAGPMLGSCCGNFGSIIAGIAHTGSVIGLVGFFEFLWLLERWNISHAVLGMIATMSYVSAHLCYLVPLSSASYLRTDF